MSRVSSAKPPESSDQRELRRFYAEMAKRDTKIPGREI
jgi:hypothetical protein